MNTDLIIIGGGAAGLMATAYASEIGLKCLIVEARHLPGRKLLLCGNNKCNLTSGMSTNEFIQCYNSKVSEFLEPALNKFGPGDLRKWFSNQGLQTFVEKDGRVYPKSRNADDVLHVFTDIIRSNNFPSLYNCRINALRKKNKMYEVSNDFIKLYAPNVLLATGGVSYPKTGSVGDGQKMVKTFGHKLIPFQPGLVGFEFDKQVKHIPMADVEIVCDNKVIGTTSGDIYPEQWGARGKALTNASSIVAHQNAKNYHFNVIPMGKQGPFKLYPKKTRPLKEAMVTVGGISLNDIDSNTMESRKSRGLYFAGEVMDVDGPTGGFNLTAAFATARLAVDSIKN